MSDDKTLHQLGIEDPATIAAMTIAYVTYEAPTIEQLGGAIAAVKFNIGRLTSDDRALAEQYLAAQILVLNAIFNRYSAAATLALGGSPAVATQVAFLALRTSENLRKTIETLDRLKNPRKTTFIKRQQNALIVNSETDRNQQLEFLGENDDPVQTSTNRSPERSRAEVDA